MHAGVKNSLHNVCAPIYLDYFPILTVPISPPLLCFYCPFLGPAFLHIAHSLLPGLLFLRELLSVSSPNR